MSNSNQKKTKMYLYLRLVWYLVTIFDILIGRLFTVCINCFQGYNDIGQIVVNVIHPPTLCNTSKKYCGITKSVLYDTGVMFMNARCD